MLTEDELIDVNPLKQKGLIRLRFIPLVFFFHLFNGVQDSVKRIPDSLEVFKVMQIVKINRPGCQGHKFRDDTRP